MAVGTKHISLIAARRRSQVHVPGSSQEEDREKAGSHLSIHFVDDMEEARYMKNTYSPHHRMEGASSLGSLLNESKKNDCDMADLPLLKTINNLRMERLRHMYVKKKSSKKRSQSSETVAPAAPTTDPANEALLTIKGDEQPISQYPFCHEDQVPRQQRSNINRDNGHTIHEVIYEYIVDGNTTEEISDDKDDEDVDRNAVDGDNIDGIINSIENKSNQNTLSNDCRYHSH
ncbi:hypothetical protein NDU88_001497 [Pleurodeles waltl]|uniref:Uncharacterized protein n=1 Tax=Pleurodeles waltl TaxID=8319 RepID=A0AAV7M0M6_PLEWA|nr:hypothetical protein NDU88_001497 [Pleurodeles waltl]